MKKTSALGSLYLVCNVYKKERTLENGVYKKLEKSYGILSELHLEQIKAARPRLIAFFWRLFSKKQENRKCCQVKNSIREAIVLGRTGKPLPEFTTTENYNKLFP